MDSMLSCLRLTYSALPVSKLIPEASSDRWPIVCRVRGIIKKHTFCVHAFMMIDPSPSDRRRRQRLPRGSSSPRVSISRGTYIVAHRFSQSLRSVASSSDPSGPRTRCLFMFHITRGTNFRHLQPGRPCVCVCVPLTRSTHGNRAAKARKRTGPKASTALGRLILWIIDGCLTFHSHFHCSIRSGTINGSTKDGGGWDMDTQDTGHGQLLGAAWAQQVPNLSLRWRVAR